MKYRYFNTLLLVLWAASCGSNSDSDDKGTDLPTTVSETVPSEGATVSVEGASLEIPKDATSDEVEITVEQLGSGAVDDLADIPAGATLVSTPVAFLPHGLSFDEPVEVTLDYDAASADAPVVAKLENDADRDWEAVAGATFSKGQAHFSITSFSVYAVLDDPDKRLTTDPQVATGGSGAGGADAGSVVSGGKTSTGGTSSGGEPSGGGAWVDAGAPKSPADGGRVVTSTLITAVNQYSTNSFHGVGGVYTTAGGTVASYTMPPALPFCFDGALPMSSYPDGSVHIELSLNESGGGPQDFTPMQGGMLQIIMQHTSDVEAIIADAAGNSWCQLIAGSVNTATLRSLPWSAFTVCGSNTPYALGAIQTLKLRMRSNQVSDLTYELCVNDMWEGTVALD